MGCSRGGPGPKEAQGHCPFLGGVGQRQDVTGHLETPGTDSPQEDLVALPDQGLLKAASRPSEHGRPAARSHGPPPVASTRRQEANPPSPPPTPEWGEWLTALLPCPAASPAAEPASSFRRQPPGSRQDFAQRGARASAIRISRQHADSRAPPQACGMGCFRGRAPESASKEVLQNILTHPQGRAREPWLRWGFGCDPTRFLQVTRAVRSMSF